MKSASAMSAILSSLVVALAPAPALAPEVPREPERASPRVTMGTTVWGFLQAAGGTERGSPWAPPSTAATSGRGGRWRGQLLGFKVRLMICW